MEYLILLPGVCFLLIIIGEKFLPCIPQNKKYTKWDWILNFLGFAFQGYIVPLGGYFLATIALPFLWPQGFGVMKTGWLGAFFLNFVGVDFLYYWQHRFFHEIPSLWKLHRCHHATPKVDVWATARNTPMIHFLFVYVLINPLLGYLCDAPQGFFFGAMLTASLDLMRHTEIDFHRTPILCTATRYLEKIFIMPREHRAHHNATNTRVNYGANLLIWDYLFGTSYISEQHPKKYQIKAPDYKTQLLYPFKR